MTVRFTRTEWELIDEGLQALEMELEQTVSILEFDKEDATVERDRLDWVSDLRAKVARRLT